MKCYLYQSLNVCSCQALKTTEHGYAPPSCPTQRGRLLLTQTPGTLSSPRWAPEGRGEHPWRETAQGKPESACSTDALTTSEIWGKTRRPTLGDLQENQGEHGCKPHALLIKQTEPAALGAALPSGSGSGGEQGPGRRDGPEQHCEVRPANPLPLCSDSLGFQSGGYGGVLPSVYIFSYFPKCL